MLEINTIQEFMELPAEHRDSILRSINTKQRLENHLLSFNEKKEKSEEPHYKKCKRCDTTGWILVEPRNAKDIHASQIHKCVKKLWYDCSGYTDKAEQNVSAQGRMIFDQGHAIHDMLQRYGESGAYCEKNFYQAEVPIVPDEEEAKSKGVHILPVAKEYRIRSFVDAINWRVILPDVPEVGDVAIRILHEYKTIGRTGYSALQRPKPEHVMQAMVYCACFCIPVVTFVYFDKDRCQIADFNIPFDPYVWGVVSTKIKTVLGYVDRGEMPPWDVTAAVQNPTECLECEYYNYCNPPIKLKKKP